jgi:hypothetical protein
MTHDGSRCRGVRAVLVPVLALILLASASSAAPQPSVPDYERTPAGAHQIDLELSNVTDFVDDGSLVRRREASTAGSALYLGPDLGVSNMQMPEVSGTFWFDSLNAIQFQWRSFILCGSEPLSSPVTFNGDVIAPGQNLNTDGTQWFTVGLFYERDISSWLSEYQATQPKYLRGWDLRPKIGLEFTYLDFRLNDGHPKLISGLLDARGRWHDQELPVPTVGLEARREIGSKLSLEVSAQGTWINKWNSLRSQKGTVYLSQSEFETHWRLVYGNSALAGLRPFVGFSYYYCRQAETSREIGNLIRLQAYGPEVGISYSFRL